MDNPTKIMGIGELLWDLLPDGRHIGGAPANVTFHTTLLGHQSIIVSRVGSDSAGTSLCAGLTELGLSQHFIQTDQTHPTGTIQVILDQAARPTFDVTDDVAWDYLEWNPKLAQAASTAQLVCFGTLAQRHRQSRMTIQRFVDTAVAAIKVCDLNIRPPYQTLEVIEEAAKLATVLKVNEEEFKQLCQLAHIHQGDDELACQQLIQRYGLELIAVTYGECGCLLATQSSTVHHRGYTVNVRDTTGAGDAFVAVLCHHLLRGTALSGIAEKANRYAGWVTTQSGAMPRADQNLLKLIV